MRLFKFFAAFFVTAVVVFGFVLGLNWKSFTIFFENREAMSEGSEWVEKTYSLRGLTEYIAMNPEHVSVASRVIGQPDSMLSYQADTPRIMGSASNFFVLAAFAVKLNRGTISGDRMISRDDVEKYILPDIDRSVHKQAWNEASNRGWLANNSITVENALQLLAEFNDPALSDFLWWEAGPDFWDEFPGMINTTQTEMPLPFSGLYLAISPHFQAKSVPEIISQWQAEIPSGWRRHVTEQSRKFHNDTTYRQDVISFMEKKRLGNTFMEERDAMTLFPKTTANEITRILQQVWLDEFMNPEVSGMIKEWMRWPIHRQSEIKRDFSDYGALYDNRMGLLNGIDFGTSVYTGDTTVQAVFFDHLPIAFWFHMSSNHMHQDFQQRLIYDPALIRQMEQAAALP